MDIIDILRDIVDNLDYANFDEVYEEEAFEAGSNDALKNLGLPTEKKEELIDIGELMVEEGAAICVKNGKYSFEYPEGLGGAGYIDIDPTHLCPEDSDYIGTWHTHPNGIVSPSVGDIGAATFSLSDFECISSPHAVACYYTEKEKVPYHGYFGDDEFCKSIEFTNYDEDGIAYLDEVNVCVKDYLEGYDKTYLTELEKMIRDRKIRGVGLCYKLRGDEKVRCVSS